jgi:hypothetical protein
VQHRPARDQQLHSRASRQQLRQLGSGWQDLLEVVEQEQHLYGSFQYNLFIF